MSAAPDTRTLSRGDLRKYPREVADVLLEAVNDYGVPYRIIDGNHIRLYCGDRDVIPFKASASRQPEYTLKYLHAWLEENWKPWAERTEVSESSLAALASCYPGQGDDDGAEETPEEEEEEDAPAAESTGDGWKPYVSGSGKSHGFLTNGTVYRCETCGHEQPYARGLHLHAIMHDEDRKQEYVRKSAEAKRSHRDEPRALEEQQEAHVSAALAALAEHHGYVLMTKDEADLVESLREQVTRLTGERDDAVTRLGLVKEAFGA